MAWEGYYSFPEVPPEPDPIGFTESFPMSYFSQQSDAPSTGWFPFTFNVGLDGFSSVPGTVKPPTTSQSLTQIVDYWEAQFKANLGMYQQGMRTASDAIAFFDNGMDKMRVDMYAFGAQGVRSYAERDRRAENGQYLRWDWLAYYRDPIVQNSGLQAPEKPLTSSQIPGGQSYIPIGTRSDAPFGVKTEHLLLAGLLLVALFSFRRK